MDRMERLYALHKLLRGRRTPISAEALAERLGCSKQTVYRAINELRNYLNAPIPEERGKGFYYDTSAGVYELPGLWFSAAEIRALLVLQQLLRNLGPGLLDAELEPLRQKIDRLLGGHAAGEGELERRIRILGMAARDAGEHFRTCANALIERRRLRIGYHARGRDTETLRTVSPQRLTHYRDCWYLDAWCHERNALRSFAVERIRSASIENHAALEIPERDLDEHYASAYGIFAGPADNIAVLRFTPERARWVADENWHPQQQARTLDDGSYELRVPYGNPTELIMDILRHGADVEVIAPPELRTQVKSRLQAALKRY